MYQDNQDLRLMFECDRVSTATHMVFAAMEHLKPESECNEFFAQGVSGVHSEGRFVFLNMHGRPWEIYRGAMGYCAVYPHAISLIGVTPKEVPWDPYQIITLQRDRDEGDTYVYDNLHKKLVEDFKAYVQFGTFTATQVYQLVRGCHLGDSSRSDFNIGEDFLVRRLGAWFRYEVCEPNRYIDSLVLHYMQCLADDTVVEEDRWLLWSLMAHMILYRKLLQ